MGFSQANQATLRAIQIKSAQAEANNGFWLTVRPCLVEYALPAEAWLRGRAAEKAWPFLALLNQQG